MDYKQAINVLQCANNEQGKIIIHLHERLDILEKRVNELEYKTA